MLFILLNALYCVSYYATFPDFIMRYYWPGCILRHILGCNSKAMETRNVIDWICDLNCAFSYHFAFFRSLHSIGELHLKLRFYGSPCYSPAIYIFGEPLKSSVPRRSQCCVYAIFVSGNLLPIFHFSNFFHRFVTRILFYSFIF